MNNQNYIIEVIKDNQTFYFVDSVEKGTRCTPIKELAYIFEDKELADIVATLITKMFDIPAEVKELCPEKPSILS